MARPASSPAPGSSDSSEAHASSEVSGAPRQRSWGWALLLYALLSLAYAAMAPAALWRTHTPYNHYALQADAWLAGSLHLPEGPPRYAGNNDFARFEGRTYISFPPVPALLITPLVATSDKVENVRDGLFFLALAGVGPSLLFLTLAELKRDGRTRLGTLGQWLLAALFGLGTVYWFSAVQGTVWFAGHVVSVAFLCGYLCASVRARLPLLAGLCLALAVGTRPSMALALPFFLHELWREQRRAGVSKASAWRKLVPFLAAGTAVAALLMVHNVTRFGAPLEFGHRYLTVGWRQRIDRWGLFSYHYLGRNLAVAFTSLPFYGPAGWRINGHGVALWLTSPFLLLALWPRRRSGTLSVCLACAAGMAALVLMYQNSGWLQFGYRFSNDFAPFLFLALALGGRRFGRGFWALALWSLLLNGFGALSFGNPNYRDRYHIDPTQRIVHQPD